MTETVRFEPARRLRGSAVAPPDKSISHRSALIGAMCGEPVRITNYLKAEDTISTLNAVRALGALVEERDNDELLIRGPGLRGAETGSTIDVGNAGTLMRLLPGWLAGQTGKSWTLDGDDSIRRRPVDRIKTPLEQMGATIEAREQRLPPFTVNGADLDPITYAMPMASGQVKSCILLAGILADGRTTVVEQVPSRDHTERMLRAAGVDVRVEQQDDGSLHVSVGCMDELELEHIVVPGDPSSAAFLVAAGILVPDSSIVVENVGTNWTRTGFFRIAERMGAVIVGPQEAVGAIATEEPIGDLDIRSGRLSGTTVGADEVPLAIDELPLVALLGCFAEGETVVTGAAELKLKESDRIATVVDGLNALGGELEATDDGFVVNGTGGLKGGTIHAHGDHRLAMLGAIAGLASQEGVEVVGMEAAAVSYPTFTADIARLVG